MAIEQPLPPTGPSDNDGESTNPQEAVSSRRQFLDKTLAALAASLPGRQPHFVSAQSEGAEQREREPEVPRQDTMVLFLDSARSPTNIYIEVMRQLMPEGNRTMRGRVGIYHRRGEAPPTSLLDFNENRGEEAIKRTRTVAPPPSTSTTHLTAEHWGRLGSAFAESGERLRRVVLVVGAHVDPAVGLDGPGMNDVLEQLRAQRIVRVDVVIVPLQPMDPRFPASERDRIEYLQVWESFCRRAGGGSVSVIPSSLTAEQRRNLTYELLASERERLLNQLRLLTLPLPARQLRGVQNE